MYCKSILQKKKIKWISNLLINWIKRYFSISERMEILPLQVPQPQERRKCKIPSFHFSHWELSHEITPNTYHVTNLNSYYRSFEQKGYLHSWKYNTHAQLISTLGFLTCLVKLFFKVKHFTTGVNVCIILCEQLVILERDYHNFITFSF